MKRFLAAAALLFALSTASQADAGIMYGNRVANRLSTGTSRFARAYRYIGRLEYRKDMWLFDRPLGDAPQRYCPNCGRPVSRHHHYRATPRHSH